MAERDDAALHVGFEIDAFDAFGTLNSLEKIFGETTGNAIRYVQNLEKQINGANFSGGFSSLKTSASASTRELQALNKERISADRIGEKLIGQLEREAAVFGKTKEEIRRAKVEAAALAAEKVGNIDLAGRLKAANEALWNKEYDLIRRVRAETDALAQDKAALAAASTKADLASRGTRLQESINPAIAAQNRFNAEMAEARTLVRAGAISLDDFRGKLVQQREALRYATSAQGAFNGATGGMKSGMQQLQFQFNDVIQQSTQMGVSWTTIATQQAPQILQAMQLMTTKSSGLLAALAGWPGVIALAAMAVGVGLYNALTKSGDAADDLSKKEQSLTDRIREQNKVLTENIALQGQKLRGEVASSQADLRTTTTALGKLLAGQAEAQKLLDALLKPRPGVAPNYDAIAMATDRLNTWTDSVKAASIIAREATQNVRGANAALIEREVAASLDKQTAALQRKEDVLGGLREQQRLGLIDDVAFRAGVEANEKKYGSEKAAIEATTKALKERSAAADKATRAAAAAAGKDGMWSLSEVESEIKKIFGAGTQITSRVRKGDPGDHGVGRALDFVPQKGLSAYSTAEVVRLLAARGIEVRTSKKGLQAFGPDRGAQTANDHDDHFHIAFEKNAMGKADIASANDEFNEQTREAKQALEEQKRAYEATVKSAQDYAAQQIETAKTTGLNAQELRMFADAAALAKAPTEQLKTAIRDAAAERERVLAQQSATEFDANVMQPMRDELALYGLVGPARDYAALALEKQAFIAQHMGDGIAIATKRWEEYYRVKSELIGKDADAALEAGRIERMNEALSNTAELLDIVAGNVQNAASGMADAFGSAGAALGDLASIYTDFAATQAQADAEHIKRLNDAKTAEQKAFENARHGLSTSTAQLGLYGDMTAAAKGFFGEKSKGYKALMAAEKVFRAFEFAMSVKSMVQDIAETISSVANSGARATAAGAEGVASQSKLPFPANIAAMAATAAALVAAGIAVLGGGGGSSAAPKTNTGTGTVLGDGDAQSESIKNAISALKDVDLLMLNTSRQMAASLRTIEDNIGSFASLLVRNADSLNANGSTREGFKANVIGGVLGKIPLIGGILKGLFGTKTTVVGSGLFGGPQSVGSILSNGFDASYYSDIQKKKKLFGITTSTRYSTQLTGADAGLENQFTLILRSFNAAILAAAGPLGAATSEVQSRLNSFVVDIGRIDLRGLTGAQIEEKLTAVFGAAADDMARAAFPLIEQYQKVGEGAFETLTRVASTIEAVTASLGTLGQTALGVEGSLALADQFESISALTGAVNAYFNAYYTREEQAAAGARQLADVFGSLNLSMPSTLAGYRALVEAQDLTSASGREAYAMLLQLAPAFAELQASMDGAKSAADIASERANLQRQLLELLGDTAALRAMELAKLDPSNRALQQQIWAIKDAQEAAKAADELRKAWQSVGDTIMDEVKRIRGITDAAGGNGFVALQGQFNAATIAARGGDQDIARTLPQLSQALLSAAADAATSRQELDRVRAQTAASLTATYDAITTLSGGGEAVSNTDLLAAVESSQSGTAAGNDNPADAAAAQMEAMRDELAQLRADLNNALATIAANTGSMKRTLDNVNPTGDALNVTIAA